MTIAEPLVTVGLPVYNGGRHLVEALESLLAQDYPRLQILISDNDSTDDTAEICRRYAQRDARIFYVRNATNIGMLNNFRRVAELADGEYFFWAAHDDRWNAQFVSALVAELARHHDAVLATPAIISTGEDGRLIQEPIDRPALYGRGLTNLSRLYDDHAIGWYYGLWRTVALRSRLEEVQRWPLWGGDVIWLATLALRDTLTGSDEALLRKRVKQSVYAPSSARAKVHFWTYMFWYLSEVSLREGRSRGQRWAGLGLSWRYVYRACIRRPGLVRTLWRVGRILVLAAISCLFLGLWSLGKRVGRIFSGIVHREPVDAVSVASGRPLQGEVVVYAGRIDQPAGAARLESRDFARYGKGHDNAEAAPGRHHHGQQERLGDDVPRR